ncbi:FAD-linked oxidoreductase-like protein [Boletus reticuloceps]|uniref:Proline dehydrogenase n=1 Tax=Boletus reticuloceps TaxID=495285 RepID=A0A8I3A2Q5_9AGAM|nr:FAD-linked oxidoreductase-like protein [Boletus reticuloceps]
MYSVRRARLALGRASAQRLYSTTPPPRTRTRRPIRTILFLTSAISGGALLGLYSDARSCPTPPFKLAESTPRPEHDISPPLSALLRTYLVYGLTTCETIVDHAPVILDTLLKVPFIGTVVESVVRRTFFAHFVGGETARAAYPLLSALRNQNKGALFAYSVEVDEHEASGEHHIDTGSDSGKTSKQPVHKRIVEEMLRSIDVAADFEDEVGTRQVAGRRTWVAIKLTALLPNADALRNLSLHLTRTRHALNPPIPYPGTPESSDLSILHSRIPERSPLTSQDVEDLKELYHDLNRICARAKDRSVRIILDAEHSWYQPAIDAFGHALMERFNKLSNRRGRTGIFASGLRSAQAEELQPIVYVTYQAYLRRTPNHLTRSLALARQNNYALGVKLVRGAYHPHELAAYSAAASSGSIAISPDPYPPVHSSKVDTDACYNECATLLVRTIADDVKSSAGRPPRIGVLFGTHNWMSSELILGELVKNGLAHEDTASTDGIHKGTVMVPSEVAERLTFGQLYGMSDSLTNYLVGRIKSTTPCIIKYVPYGALVEVMPYISRRAIENKSVLGNGGAVRERKEAARLIWKRVFGGVGL